MKNRDEYRFKPQSVQVDLEWLAKKANGYCFENKILMVNNNRFNETLLSVDWRESLPFRLDIICCVLVVEGTFSLSIDYKPFSLSKNSLLFISQFNIVAQPEISEDGRLFVLMFKKEFMDEIAKFEFLHIDSRLVASTAERAPFIQLSDYEMYALQKRFQSLYYYLKEDRKELKRYFIFSTFITLGLEFIYYINDRFGGAESIEGNSGNITSNQKNTIFKNFIILLRQHYIQEHSPAFYADNLNISVQYLSLILKQKTNLTASDWIANTLVLKAKQLLRAPDASISEVAEQLCFADQSSFGKFFKKHTGQTPKNYINSQL